MLAAAGDPETLTRQVTRIVDGDTVVLVAQGTKRRVRLTSIDAPEWNQPWGEAATRKLRRQVAGQVVGVEWSKRDRWKRLIGVVRHDGEDVNLHMVDRGLEWHYKRYAGEQAPEQREAYSAAEKAAREARRGIWSDPEPVAPWDSRKR